MHLFPNEFYHIYNRSNNRQKIFFTNENYLFFLQKIKKHIAPVSKVIAYCLMPDHFHMLIMATETTIKQRSSFGGKPMQEFPYLVSNAQQLYKGHQQTKQHHTIVVSTKNKSQISYR